jgi:hypothetical protein
MILDVFGEIFKPARVCAVIKSAMLSMSFPDCVTVCPGMANFFPLQVEDSSSVFGDHSFVELVYREHTERGELVQAKVCVRECNGKSQTSGAAVERTLLDKSGKDDVNRNCTCGVI